MPSVHPPSKVLVTGANGYIAVWVVKSLLDKGYSVRGTVRSQQKAQHLLELFKIEKEKGLFEVVIVPDITTDGAFDEAIKGVDAIEHTASPFYLDADDPDELIVPAVQGTVGVLKSAVLHAPQVKRIIVTSSVAAILSQVPEKRTFNEEDWNDQAIAMVRADGRDAPAIAKYRASKTLAEKAAWDVQKNEGERIGWDLVLGPVLHEVPSPEKLNTSAKGFYDTVVRPDSGGKTPEMLASSSGAWIDVRDLGLAHATALEKEEAGGQRIIISAGPLVWQDVLDVANSLSPCPIPSHAGKLAKGVPGSGTKYHHIMYSSEKEKKILGLKLHNLEQVTRDSLADFERKGW